MEIKRLRKPSGCYRITTDGGERLYLFGVLFHDIVRLCATEEEARKAEIGYLEQVPHLINADELVVLRKHLEKLPHSSSN